MVDTSIPMEDRPKWFEGAKLNFGENMVKFRDDHVAIIAAGKMNKISYYNNFMCINNH